MQTTALLAKLAAFLPATFLLAQISVAKEAEQATPQEPPPTAGWLVYEVYNSEGIDAAITRFRELLADESGEHAFLEREFITIGSSMMLGRGKRDDAIRFLQLVVEKFPESSMAWFGLGSAHLACGNKEKAAACIACRL